MKVLFIGATGIVGSQVVPLLQDRYEFTLAARGGGETGGLPVADVDIADLESIEALVSGESVAGGRFDAIVNCAIAPHREFDHSSPAERHRYFESCIDINARGAFHVYEAAARAAVPRVVYISSMTAVTGPPRPERFDAETRDRPVDVYAASKVFGEHVGRYYAYRPECMGNLQVLCLRLGQPYKSFNNWDNLWPERADVRSFMTDCRDIAQSIECALHTDIRYGVYSILSDSDHPSVSPELYSELGFRPGWKFTAEGLLPVDYSEHSE